MVHSIGAPARTALTACGKAADGLRSKLRSGECVIGAMVGLPSPELVDMICLAGFDFVTIDVEHEPIDDSAVIAMIRAADVHHLPVIIRSPLSHRVVTLLNVGAAGVQVCDVRGADHLQQIADRVRFPPRGHRAGTLLSRIAGYGSPAAPDPSQQPDPIVIAMIEDVQVAAEMDALIEMDVADAFHIGPYDLGASMGDASDEDVQRVIQDVVSRCASSSEAVAVGVVSSRSAGSVVSGVGDLARRRAQGVRLFVVATSMFVAQQLADYRVELGHAVGGTPP